MIRGSADTATDDVHRDGDSRGAIEVRDVDAGYGRTMVLRGVNLSVPPSTVVALLGPNGAGKSTLLRVATGLLTPARGSVLLNGRDVTRASTKDRARAGLCHIPEGRGIFPSLSVRENILIQIPRSESDGAEDRAIELFPALGPKLKQVAGSLSGGEQQMLALLRAHLTNPTIVLVDEASLGLSPVAVDRIFDALRTIVARGSSLLLVEQYIHRALELADFAYVLNRGRIAYSGEASELRDSDVVAHYLGEGPAV